MSTERIPTNEEFDAIIDDVLHHFDLLRSEHRPDFNESGIESNLPNHNTYMASNIGLYDTTTDSETQSDQTAESSFTMNDSGSEEQANDLNVTHHSDCLQFDGLVIEIHSRTLECPICMMPYRGIPKLLPCGHTICIACIDGCSNGRFQFPCPICKQIARGTHFVNNFALSAVLESYTELLQQKCMTLPPIIPKEELSNKHFDFCKVLNKVLIREIMIPIILLCFTISIFIIYDQFLDAELIQLYCMTALRYFLNIIFTFDYMPDDIVLPSTTSRGLFSFF